MREYQNFTAEGAQTFRVPLYQKMREYQNTLYCKQSRQRVPLYVEKQNNPASKCHFIPAVFFKKMGQLSDRICLFQHVCQFRPTDCLLQ